MMATISAFQKIRDGIKFHFPFIESYLAVLPIVDEFIIIEGCSDDGTYEKLLELQKHHPQGKKIKIIRQEWKKTDPPPRIQADLDNQMIEMCQSEWYWQVSADEIYHEKDLSLIKQLTEDAEVDWYYFGFYNIWSNKFDKYLDYSHSGFIQSRLFRFARKITYPYAHARMDGCISDVAGLVTKFRKKDVSEKVRFYHYSYARHPKALKDKANYMLKEFYHKTDPRFNRVDVLDYPELLPKHEILKPLPLPRPAIMKEWEERERKGE